MIFRCINTAFSLSRSSVMTLLATVPSSVTLYPCPPVLFVSNFPSAPHMISLSPNCVANVLVAWPWQPRPSPYTDTEVLLSPTTSQTLRATTLYQPSCCFSHLLFASVAFNPSFVSVLLCSVWNTDGPPAVSNSKLFFWSADNSHVEKSKTSWSYTAETCGLVVWRNSTASFWPIFAFGGSTFHAFFHICIRHVLLHNVCRLLRENTVKPLYIFDSVV